MLKCLYRLESQYGPIRWELEELGVVAPGNLLCSEFEFGDASEIIGVKSRVFELQSSQ